MIPCIEVLKEILVNDTNNEDTNETLNSSKNCGIAGSQLSNLLVVQPRLFCYGELKIRHLVTRISDMGLSTKSRMFVHGLHALSCMSEETFDIKLELFRSYGFFQRRVR